MTKVMKEAKGTMPQPDILERRVQSVSNHVCIQDSETDVAKARGEELDRKRHFKPMSFSVAKGKRRTKISESSGNQMLHMRKGCLSNPDSQVFKHVCVNTKTKKACTARSTGGCEVSHRELNGVFDTPS